MKEGFDDVIVQSTHVMNGEEYDFITSFVTPYKPKFKSLSIGKPLLTSDADYDEVVECIRNDILPLAKGSPMVLMGHGTTHFANATYSELQLKLRFAGLRNVYITTVEGFPDFGNTIEMLKEDGVKKVTLMPFMIVAGDHANNDMAGDDDDSLKSVLKAEGIEADCVVMGLGSLPSFRRMFAEHAKAAKPL